MTLGQALAAKVPLLVWFKRCWHRAEPEVADRIARYGADLPVPEWTAARPVPKKGYRMRLRGYLWWLP
jgi:hypothetical protein